MPSTSVPVREAPPQWSRREEHRSTFEGTDLQRWAQSTDRAATSATQDVLELLLLHGDCAFLLDLREL